MITVVLPEIVPTQRHRFYDGGEPADDDGEGGEPPNREAELQIRLDRRLVDGDEIFLLTRRIAYDDRHCGEIVVPPVYASFTSDLTSVPALFTWLVPKTGAHLPAALIHDGLVGDPHDPTYISTEGHTIDRVEADRIFRDGMADTGTGLVRRWLVWTAVTLATMWARDSTSSRAAVRVYYQVIVAATLASIAWLGYVATADLFDRAWWLTYELPWMGDRSFGAELVTGAAGAIAIPLALGLSWGRFHRAGFIAGVALGLLFHVTIALAAVLAVYQALERVAVAVPTLALRLGTAAVTLAAGAVFVIALL
ncbi:MAG: DUF1353 domain-containing protein [Ilumatobacter sp.]|uniref:DUF1353 domain-containing protein n=1 Tax=Ilumatobacter sp. TaxID=1967498 RepID=UPI00262AD642|nr:DUF1353 domain-containing protein [Ilumatobacter sp.]MDJ0768536.1 DUF1353 domain-containing protein [Ilumatobacter sp.]